MRRCLRETLVLTAVLVGTVRAEDWPTYRHDVARSGVTADRLQVPLSPCWVFQPLHAPQPAWGDPKPVPVEDFLELRRVHFDDVFHVAAAGGAVFFGSSANHKLYCLDGATGKIRWTKITGGPIRLAPTVQDGRVYAVSDDGYAYCWQAADGGEVWKFRAAPEDRRILGNGKLISLWPPRTGVLVDAGVAYFGAGVFPAEGVFLYAVSAADGKLQWRNDATGEKPQSRVSPQGYLLASPSTLYAPMARMSPAAFDRADGKLLFETGFGREAGGTYALLAGSQVYAGTERLVAFDQQRRDKFAAFEGRKIIVTDQVFYVATDKELQASDRQTKTAVWKTRCAAADELILANGLLVAGAAGRVLAVDAATGAMRWEAAVEGTAKGLAVAAGRLFVSTDQGRIYCFGPPGAAQHGTAPEPAAQDPWPDSPQNAVLSRAAESILRRTKIRRGFCLVLGCESGKLAYELARRSELVIYAVSPDAGKVAAARPLLDATGLYGARVCVEQQPLERLPYPDYFANLIVSETAALTGQWPGDPREAVRMLKPLGGELLIGQPDQVPGGVPAITEATAQKWLAPPALADAKLVRDDGTWLTLVRGPLPGAGQWTHQYANPGNTACGDDQLVKCPLGVLWFGLPGQGEMVNRHERAAGPVSRDGRLFIQGENLVMAYDIYNGVRLWQRQIAGARRGNASHDGSNFAVGPAGLFVGCGDTCLRLDPATGQTLSTYKLPLAAGGFTRWGMIATEGQLLYGSRAAKVGQSNAVFAIHADNGQEAWRYEAAGMLHTTITLGDGGVFLVSTDVSAQQRKAALEEQRRGLAQLPEAERQKAEAGLEKALVRLVTAVDAGTGTVRWQKPLELTACGQALGAMYQDGALVVFGVHLDGHYWKEFFAGQFTTRRVAVLATKDGSLLWSQPVGYRVRPLIIGNTLHAEPWAFDLQTGQPRMRVNPFTGLEERWQFARPGHHCGCPSASPHCLFFRSWCLGYYDLDGDYGTMHFGAQRPGCWINFLPTGGLVVMPEASTGCMCDFPNKCTVVFQPTQQPKAWAWYSVAGPLTPIRHLAVKFGAPGDRRDSRGVLWLGFPRPSGSLVLNLKNSLTFYPKGGCTQENSVYANTAGTSDPWLFAGGAVGLQKCVLPLVEPGDGKATYRVRLLFADPDHQQAGQRVFQIQLQGRIVAAAFDIVRAAGGGQRATSVEFEGVPVEDKLTVSLVAQNPKAPLTALPILHGLEITRERFVGVGCTPPAVEVNNQRPERAAEVRLANLREQAFTGTLRFRPPRGVEIAPPESALTLATGQRKAVPVTARITAGLPAGMYEVPLQLVRPDGGLELERTVCIEHLGTRARVVIPACEDAHVTKRYGARNVGAAGVLLVDGGNAELGDDDHSLAFLKFRLDLPGKPVLVRFRVTNAGNATGDAGSLRLVEEPWSETKITYANMPKRGRELARLGAVAEDQVIERKLDLDLTGRSELSLAIDPTSNDGTDFLSRESGTPPALIVDYEE